MKLNEDLAEKRKLISKPNGTSDRMVMAMRKKKLGEIFDEMDDDQDGEISHSLINTKFLSLELKHAFKPLLQELEQLQQPLDREEFIDAGMRLYNVSNLYFFHQFLFIQTLSQNEKNQILKFGQKGFAIESELMKCTFVPKTNFSNIASRIDARNPKSPKGA